MVVESRKLHKEERRNLYSWRRLFESVASTIFFFGVGAQPSLCAGSVCHNNNK